MTNTTFFSEFEKPEPELPINLRAGLNPADWTEIVRKRLGYTLPSDVIPLRLGLTLNSHDEAEDFARTLAPLVKSAYFTDNAVERPSEDWLEWLFELRLELKDGGEVRVVTPYLWEVAAVLHQSGKSVNFWPDGWEKLLI